MGWKGVRIQGKLAQLLASQDRIHKNTLFFPRSRSFTEFTIKKSISIFSCPHLPCLELATDLNHKKGLFLQCAYIKATPVIKNYFLFVKPVFYLAGYSILKEMKKINEKASVWPFFNKWKWRLRNSTFTRGVPKPVTTDPSSRFPFRKETAVKVKCKQILWGVRKSNIGKNIIINIPIGTTTFLISICLY